LFVCFLFFDSVKIKTKRASPWKGDAGGREAEPQNAAKKKKRGENSEERPLSPFLFLRATTHNVEAQLKIITREREQ
jgi:hypothetical protein